MKRLFSIISLLCLTLCSWADFYPVSYPTNPQGSTIIYFDLKLNDVVIDPYDYGNNYQVGAFIGDECRAVAELMSTMIDTQPGTTIPYLQLEVRGNYTQDASDTGKEITFKLFERNQQATYTLTSDQQVKFGSDASYGSPSGIGVARVQLEAHYPTQISANDITVGLSSTVDLTTGLTLDPQNAQLPLEATWSVGNRNIATIKGSILTPKATGTTTYTLTVPGGMDVTGGPMYTEYTANVTINNPATAINVSQTTYDAYMGHERELNAFLNSVYTLVPAGSTDQVTWQIGNEAIIKQNASNAQFTMLKTGTTTMTPVILNETGGVRVRGTAITITVKQLVTSLNQSDEGIMSNVGDNNIISRLEQLVEIVPSSATNKTLSWSINQNEEVLRMTNGVITAVKAGHADVMASTTDGSNLSIPFMVDVMDPATTATFKQNPMTIAITHNNGTDITSQIFNNITLNGTTSKNAVITISSTPQDAVTGRGAITDNGNNGTFTAYKQGTATVTVTLTWMNYTTGENQSQAYTFTVNITENLDLSSFTVTVTPDNTGTAGTVTLTPVPANANFDINDYTVAATVPAGNNLYYGNWEAINILPDKQNPLSYDYTAVLPGQFVVQVTRGADVVMGVSDPFEVPYVVNLAQGWQWKSNNFVSVEGSKGLEAFFGENLIEARTQTKLLYNDQSWGYVGSMLNSDVAIEQMQMYKANMKNATTAYLYGGSLPYMMTVPLAPGWNWVGSPYFYNRQLSVALTSNGAPDGLYIQGKNGFAEMTNGQWVGTKLPTINSGEGYLVYNPSADNIRMTWSTEVGVMDQVGVPAGARAMNASVWHYDASRFADNMSVVATLGGIDHPEQYTVGAFVDGECRGEGEFVDGRLFAIVHANQGEQVTFVLHNEYTDEYVSIDQTLHAQTRVGSYDNPFAMTAGNEAQGIDSIQNSTFNIQNSHDLQGRKVTDSSRQNINIVRMRDGSVRKVIR